jgi:anthranilate phosphoribosyltransferase
MRFAAPVRRQLPFRTLMNLVGPLANPARPDFQLIGVAGDRQGELMAQALARLGTRGAAIVTGSDGLDEVTLAGPTHVRWVDGSGRVIRDTWYPADFGLPRVDISAVRVGSPAESAARLERLFAGEAGPVRDLVLANAAAALRVAGRVDRLAEGVARAAEALDSGAAARLLERWRRFNPLPI